MRVPQKGQFYIEKQTVGLIKFFFLLMLLASGPVMCNPQFDYNFLFLVTAYSLSYITERSLMTISWNSLPQNFITVCKMCVLGGGAKTGTKRGTDLPMVMTMLPVTGGEHHFPPLGSISEGRKYDSFMMTPCLRKKKSHPLAAGTFRSGTSVSIWTTKQLVKTVSKWQFHKTLTPPWSSTSKQKRLQSTFWMWLVNIAHFF